MEIMAYLDKAMQVEDHLAECYKALAAWCDQKIAAQLNRLSREEINHRNILNMGKTFITNAPDLFGGVVMSEAELDRGLQDIDPLLNSLRAKQLNQRDALAQLIELERRLEKVHMRVSIDIKEPSLQDLFHKLSAGDQNHVAVLDNMINDLP